MDITSRLLILASTGLLVWAGTLALQRYFAGASVPGRFDRRDVGINGRGPLLVEFTSPYCYDCQLALPLLQAASAAHAATLAVVDAKQRPELAVKYAIRHTPTILVVDGQGAIRGGWLGPPPPAELDVALQAANA